MYAAGRLIPMEDEKAWNLSWGLSVGISKCGGSFQGEWHREGFPFRGCYMYSTGECLEGEFSSAYMLELTDLGNYTGMLFDGKPNGYGWCDIENSRIYAEFKNGDYHGYVRIVFHCSDKAVFKGRNENNYLKNGQLELANGIGRCTFLKQSDRPISVPQGMLKRSSSGQTGTGAGWYRYLDTEGLMIMEETPMEKGALGAIEERDKIF